jgi:hypothetical protein
MSLSSPLRYPGLGAASTILLTVFVALAGGTQVARGQSHPAHNSACSAIISVWGDRLNTTYFMQACSEPSFQAAFDQWGLANFSTSSGGGPGWADNYYEFDSVGACNDASAVKFGPQCALQEYWTVNLTTQKVSGPTILEGPVACACPAQLAHGPASLVVPAILVVLAGGAAAAAAVLLMRRRRRARPPLASSPEET